MLKPIQFHGFNANTEEEFQDLVKCGFFFLKVVLCDPLSCAITSSGKASLINKYDL